MTPPADAMHLQYFDAKPHVASDAVRSAMHSLLAVPSDEILDQILDRYHDDEAMRLVGAIDDDENLLGLLGLRLDDTGIATLLHLYIHDGGGDAGIGEALIRKGVALYRLDRLSGRSSELRLPFFTGLGFEHWLVGEKPRGSKWFGVRWQRAPQ